MDWIQIFFSSFQIVPKAHTKLEKYKKFHVTSHGIIVVKMMKKDTLHGRFCDVQILIINYDVSVKRPSSGK